MSNPLRRRSDEPSQRSSIPFRRTGELTSTTPISSSPPFLTLNFDSMPLADYPSAHSEESPGYHPSAAESVSHPPAESVSHPPAAESVSHPEQPATHPAAVSPTASDPVSPAISRTSLRQFNFGFNRQPTPMPATPSTSSHHLLPPPQNQPATPPAYSPSPTEEFPPPYARFDFPAAPKPAHIRWTDVSRGIFHHRSPGAITPHTWPSPRGEKARMTRTRRNLLLGVLVFLFFLIIILGSVLGARHNRSTPVPLTPDQHEPGTLPLGALALRPFRFADRLSTCVSTPRQWSCTLPPDTTFPTTNATNDGTRVPLFNFNIKRSSKTPFSTVPDAPTDYPLLLTADNVTTPGAKTDFYISLTTSTSPTASTGSGTLAPASLVLPNVFENQPLRLFNPGAQDEHYAAHIYFQKSVQFPNNTFASNTVPASNTVLDTGGVAASDAGYRVVWNWTRFRVAVYTRREAVETEVYIDRAGTGEEKSVMAYYLGENGEADKVLWVNEKRGVGTEKRGCFCRWGSED